MIDREELLSFSKVSGLLPADDRGQRPSVELLKKWATRGDRGVRLEAVKLGRSWFTSVAAVIQFGQARANLFPDGRRREDPSGERARVKAEAECRRLEAMGL